MAQEHPQRTLVTGATGFIGSELCSQLRRHGVPVRALARRAPDHSGPWNDTVTVDLRESIPAEVLRNVHTVFHIAGHAHAETHSPRAESDHYAVNTEGTRRLVAAAVGAGVRRFVYLSTVKAESPDSAYGRSKRDAEDIVINSSIEHAVVVRAALVYGPGVKGNLARMRDAIARGRFPPPPETGNRRSLVHVYDLCDALLLAAEQPHANRGILTATDGESYSTHRIYAALRAAAGKPPVRRAVPMPLWRLLSRAGDLLGCISRRRMPFDSQTLRKLMGDAYHPDDGGLRALGWKPEHRLTPEALLRSS